MDPVVCQTDNFYEQGKTVVIETVQKPSYIICRSKKSFDDSTKDLTARQVNETLNLNLGLPIVPENQTLRKTLKWINILLIMWWEEKLFRLIRATPLVYRRWLCMKSWRIYLSFHKRLIGNRSGIHPDVSEEYHALTSIVWWGRLFPVTLPRMRFALSQLSAWTDNHVTSNVTTIDHIMMEESSDSSFSNSVTGKYIHSGKKIGNDKVKVIFWLYGGAYLSGDVDGNLSPAEMVGKTCGCDIFIPSYSLVPEAKFDEIIWDVALAYNWLVTVKKVEASDIILYGISSGAGLATRLMQMIGKKKRGEKVYPSCLSTILIPSTMPNGAVLVCPFVDYTEPDPEGSFLQYSKHDLIVNQSVLEVGLPYFDSAMGKHRREYSPCYDDCYGLPPLCVIVSQHETVYDQSLLLVNRARSQGVPVTLGVWKYVGHVFSLISDFCPEGQQASELGCEWINHRISEKS